MVRDQRAAVGGASGRCAGCELDDAIPRPALVPVPRVPESPPRGSCGCARVFADKKSGKNAEREELWKCLDYLRPGD
ncbi:hypothetical protein AB0C13_38750, partial [Streptomyces sp. NPDC049099]